MTQNGCGMYDYFTGGIEGRHEVEGEWVAFT